MIAAKRVARHLVATAVFLAMAGQASGAEAPKASAKVAKAAAAASTSQRSNREPATRAPGVRPGARNMINPQPLPPKVVRQ